MPSTNYLDLFESEFGLEISSEALVKSAPRLIAIARTHLSSLFSDCVRESGGVLPPALKLNVSLRIHGYICGSMSADGFTLEEQIRNAVQRAAEDHRFSVYLTAASLHLVSIELWIQMTKVVIPLQERFSADCFVLGEHGLELRCEDKSAYYKPSVAITAKAGVPQRLLSKLCRKAGLDLRAWENAMCEVYKTTWVHLAQDSVGQIRRLSSLRAAPPDVIDRSVIKELVIESCDYLLANQMSDGTFAYKYDPLENLDVREKANPVRSSGCAYAIARAASNTFPKSSQLYKASAKKAVTEILDRIVFDGDTVYVADRGSSITPSGKLGSTSLLLLALLTPTLRNEYKEQIALLAHSVKGSQGPTGLFRCSFGGAQEKSSQINFFPGQALLALVEMSCQGDKSSWNVVERAFPIYRKHFREFPTTAFVGWHVDVWSKAAEVGQRAEYADFAFEQIDWILRLQDIADADSFSYGGFSKRGEEPNYSSIVYTEALIRGASLALRIGDSRYPIYKAALHSALQFCFRLRITNAMSLFLPRPDRAIGGVSMSRTDFCIRADVVQHNITMGLALLESPAELLI